MTKMLSLDTSMTATGYALFIDGELKEYGCIYGDKKCDSETRFEKMIDDIYAKMDEYKPDIVVTELTSVARNVNVQRKLTMVLGAVWGRCLLTKCYYHSFRASEWRKLVDAEKKPRKREELKRWSMDKVNSLLNTEIDNDNISDAILIGLAYINLFKEK